MQKKIALFISLGCSFVLFGVENADVAQLKKNLSTLSKQLDNLNKTLNVLSGGSGGSVQTPSSSTQNTLYKKELDDLIARYQLRDIANIGERNLPAALPEEYAKKLKAFEPFATAQEIEEYQYLGVRAFAHQIDQKFVRPFLQKLRQDEELSNPFLYGEALKNEAQLIENYYGAPKSWGKKWADDWRFLLIRLLQMLREYEKDSKVEDNHSFEEVKSRSTELSGQILWSIASGFVVDDKNQLLYKGDGIDSSPFSKSEMDLYKITYNILKEFGDPNDAYIQFFERSVGGKSVIKLMEEWVGKAPVKQGPLSQKEIWRKPASQEDIEKIKEELEKEKKKSEHTEQETALQKKTAEMEKKRKELEEKRKEKEAQDKETGSCDGLKKQILAAIELLDKQVEDKQTLDSETLKKLAQDILRYGQAKCSPKEILEDLTSFIAREAGRYKAYKQSYDRPKAIDMASLIKYYIKEKDEETNTSIGLFRIYLKQDFNLDIN